MRSRTLRGANPRCRNRVNAGVSDAWDEDSWNSRFGREAAIRFAWKAALSLCSEILHGRCRRRVNCHADRIRMTANEGGPSWFCRLRRSRILTVGGTRSLPRAEKRRQHGSKGFAVFRDPDAIAGCWWFSTGMRKAFGTSCPTPIWPRSLNYSDSPTASRAPDTRNPSGPELRSLAS